MNAVWVLNSGFLTIKDGLVSGEQGHVIMETINTSKEIALS